MFQRLTLAKKIHIDKIAILSLVTQSYTAVVNICLKEPSSMPDIAFTADVKKSSVNNLTVFSEENEHIELGDGTHVIL